MTIIQYFIPEDGDKEEEPNVFQAPSSRNTRGVPPTLGQIKASFPLKNDGSHFHFRFKSPVIPGGDKEKGNFGVWMDCLDDNQPVPLWNGTVVAKLSRVPSTVDPMTPTHFDDKEVGHNKRTTPTTKAPSQQQISTQQKTTTQQPTPPSISSSRLASVPEAPPDLFGSGASPAASPAATHKSSSTAPAAAHTTNNAPDFMMGDHVSGTNNNHISGTTNFGTTNHNHNSSEDLLGEFASANLSPSTANNNHHHSDFYGMTTPAPTPNPPPLQQPQQQVSKQPQPVPQPNHPHAHRNHNSVSHQTKPSQKKPQHPAQNTTNTRTKQGGGNSFEKFAQQHGDFGDLSNWQM